MKRSFAASIVTIAAFLFIHPAMAAAPSQVHWPWRHHHRHNQCKQACKDEYNRCKHNHGGQCKAERRACERSCH
jgi:hypothetical protein